MIFSEIWEFFKNIFFYRTPTLAASKTKHVCAAAVDLLHIRIVNLNWIESYEKETKHIHASAADLLNTRVKISTGANAGIAKSKREK